MLFKLFNGFSSQRQLLSLCNVNVSVKGKEDVHPAARTQLSSLDYALRFVTFQMSVHMKIYSLKKILFNKGESWSELNNLRFCVNDLPLVLAGRCEEVAAALEIIPPEVATREFVKLAEDGNVISSAKEYRVQPSSTFSDHEVLYAEVVWPSSCEELA